MALEITRYFYCDYQLAHHGKEVAAEALDQPDAPDGAGVPKGWVRLTLEQVVQNPEWGARVKQASQALAEQRGAKPAKQEVLDYLEQLAALDPNAAQELVVEDQLALGPDAAPLLTLLGYDGFGVDPSTVLNAAAAALGTPSLPPLDLLLDGFVAAVKGAQADGKTDAEATKVALQATLDLIRATFTPYSGKDVERALLTACKGAQP